MNKGVWQSPAGAIEVAVKTLHAVQYPTGRQSEVPAGGSHQWAVQTPQCCEAPRSGYCGGTCEYIHVYCENVIEMKHISDSYSCESI